MVLTSHMSSKLMSSTCSIPSLESLRRISNLACLKQNSWFLPHTCPFHQASPSQWMATPSTPNLGVNFYSILSLALHIQSTSKSWLFCSQTTFYISSKAATSQLDTPTASYMSWAFLSFGSRAGLVNGSTGRRPEGSPTRKPDLPATEAPSPHMSFQARGWNFLLLLIFGFPQHPVWLLWSSCSNATNLWCWIPHVRKSWTFFHFPGWISTKTNSMYLLLAFHHWNVIYTKAGTLVPRTLPSLYWVLNKHILNERSVDAFILSHKPFRLYTV